MAQWNTQLLGALLVILFGVASTYAIEDDFHKLPAGCKKFCNEYSIRSVYGTGSKHSGEYKVECIYSVSDQHRVMLTGQKPLYYGIPPNGEKKTDCTQTDGYSGLCYFGGGGPCEKICKFTANHILWMCPSEADLIGPTTPPPPPAAPTTEKPDNSWEIFKIFLYVMAGLFGLALCIACCCGIYACIKKKFGIRLCWFHFPNPGIQPPPHPQSREMSTYPHQLSPSPSIDTTQRNPNSKTTTFQSEQNLLT